MLFRSSGGAGYIGGAIAEELDRRGWRVAILTRVEHDTVRFPLFVCDITDEVQVKKTIESIVESYGSIQACIHAATAALDRKTILATSPSSFMKSINTALCGGFLLAKETVPHMRSGSLFIGITTEALEVQKPPPAMGAYVTAKYALRGLLRVLAGELAGKGVRVYAVAPGFLPGGLNGDLPEGVIEFIKKKTANIQMPEDVARLIGDLCSDSDAFPSGSSLSVLPRTASPL